MQKTKTYLAALVLTCASTVSAADLVISGSCPGDITIDIIGASPSSTGALVGSTSEGQTTVPNGSCAGTPLDLAGASLLTTYSTGPGGNHTIERTLPDNLCGFLLQSIDLSNCETTTVESIPGGCSGWIGETVSERIVGPLGLAAADLDEDGDADLVTAGWLDDRISWWENNGNGSSWTERVIAESFDGAGSVAIADLDGDGDPDVVGAAVDSDAISWWENLGDAVSWSFHPIDSTFSHPRSILAADLDGDNDLDLVATAFDGNSISWLENLDGDGTAWQKAPIVAATFDGGVSVTTGDLDGDGDLDVLGAGWIEDELAWWQNDGSGGGWTPRTVDGNADAARDVATSDLDGDGDLDVLAAIEEEDTLLWYENLNGIGTAWSPRTIDGAFDGAASVTIADLDGDGDPDVVGGAIWDDAVVWWENNGSGGGWTPQTIAGDFDAPYDLVTADFDGDGDLDAAGIAHLGNALRWWRNDGASCRSVSREDPSSAPAAREPATP